MKKLSQTKKYFAVLILFLLCLNAGVFAFGWQTYSLAYDREVQKCRERYEEVLYSVYYRYYAGEATYSGLFSSSLSSTISSPSSSIILVSDYNYPYAIIDENGTFQVSTFPHPQETPLDTEAGTVIRRKLSGKTYLLCTDYTEIGSHKLVVGWDITFLVKNYRELAWKNALISLLLSGIFAAVLYRIQRKPAKEAVLSAEAPAVTGAENPAGSEEASAEAVREVRRVPVELGSLCREALEQSFDAADEKGISLSGSAVPGAVIAGDPEKISLLLSCLLNTALLSCREEGAISLTVEKMKDRIAIALAADADSFPESRVAECRRILYEQGGELVENPGKLTAIWMQGDSRGAAPYPG